MLFLGIIALILVSTVVSIFERVDDIDEHKPPFWVVITYYLSRIPQDVFLIAPISVLLTTLLITGSFARNSEIIAMLAGGVSIYRIMVPLLIIGFIMSLLMLGLNEFVVPVTNRMNIESLRRIKGKPDRSKMAKIQIWFRGRQENTIYDENRIYYINALIPERRDASGKLYPPEVQGLTVFDLNQYFVPINRLDASRAVYNRSRSQNMEDENPDTSSWLAGILKMFRNSGDQEEMNGELGTWTLYQGSQRTLTSLEDVKIATFQELQDYLIPRTFEEFRRDTKSPVDMNYRELKEYIQTLTESGFDVSEYIVDLRAKFSYPFVSLVMVIIGFPFALRSPRSGAAFGIGVSVFIGLTYWIILQLGVSLGHAQILPPTIAAWISHLMFASAGFYLILSTRT
jgi:lipopolysaccharide export LptBFGC system permease protein LptF